MSTAAVTPRVADLAGSLRGRPLLHGAVDYLVVGGGLSLATAAVIVWSGSTELGLSRLEFAWMSLALNSAHFASSTVRLYAKPGALARWPFLTAGLPVLALVVLTAAIWRPEGLGQHLQSLYLTWSPYHYAAQAYGLACVYAFRSGCRLGGTDKKLLWWVAMLPFFHAFLVGEASGLGWLVSRETIRTVSWLPAVLDGLRQVLLVTSFVAPAVLFARVWRLASGPLPVISLLVVVANGVWWLVLSPMGAFIWATFFHALQYLAVVVLFHVKDQVARPGNRHGAAWHAVTFYGGSLLLGYGLFRFVPQAFTVLGFGVVESLLLVTAAINIHHFIVDAFIWRLKGGDSNRRIVEGAVAPA